MNKTEMMLIVSSSQLKMKWLDDLVVTKFVDRAKEVNQLGTQKQVDFLQNRGWALKAVMGQRSDYLAPFVLKAYESKANFFNKRVDPETKVAFLLCTGLTLRDVCRELIVAWTEEQDYG
jgi:hypothetical protein